jgi:hypothetical protein
MAKPKADCDRLCGSMVIVQHSAQALTPPDCSHLSEMARFWKDQPVSQTLVIAFFVIMCHELVSRFAQRALAKQNHAV